MSVQFIHSSFEFLDLKHDITKIAIRIVIELPYIDKTTLLQIRILPQHEIAATFFSHTESFFLSTLIRAPILSKVVLFMNFRADVRLGT